MKCQECNNEVPANAKFCNHCGAKIENQGKTCPKCGRGGLPAEALFCPDCGTKLTGANGSFATFTETVKGVPFDMVAVEGGSFIMGSPPNEAGRNDDEVQHRVTLSNFYIGKFAVTQELWETVMGHNPSKFRGYNLPVETVSWDDCQSFLKRLNQLTGKTYRLPTEAQWEYAARGGTQSKGYIYAGSNNINEVAEYGGNNKITTNPVGGKNPNELGFYDMSGNVWEWSQDWYGNYLSTPQENPVGPSTGASRVNRGGSRYSLAPSCRVANRGNDSPGYHSCYLGLRLVLAS